MLPSMLDATFYFYVEDEGYPVEEGMLITFPGGSVPHHIEMKREDGGFVHMLGPVEVGGSHGTVGQVLRNLILVWPNVKEDTRQTARATVDNQSVQRMLEVDGSEQDQDSTTTTSTHNITGEISVTGYRDGIDFNGVINHTLEVAYRLEGLGSLNCSAVDCFLSADIIKDQPNFCESAKIIGQMMNDEPSDQSDDSTTGDAAGSYTFLDLEDENLNTNITDVIEGVMYINIGKPVTYFFDIPMVLYGLDERMLACSVFTEVTAEAKSAAEEDITSGASSYRVALWTIAVFVSSAVAFIASL